MILSKRSFEQARQHGQSIEECGKALEQIAKRLERQMLPREQIEFIEHTGQQIQRHGQIMTALVERALQDKQYSTETFALLHQQHHQAVLLHIKAIKVMVQIIRSFPQSH